MIREDMELVYLWVEEYKNIHKQGFNFSPKFNCNYDPDTNALTIDENDELHKRPLSKLIKDISTELGLV